jgi:hypothetical protein
MSNINELNIAEIDTVVGGAGTSQTAAILQTSTVGQSTNTMVHVPSKTGATGYDLSAVQAFIEARRR